MKQTRVPAQITTVEDKIAGNLSFTQILLFIAALFFSTFVYLVFPTPLKFTYYKLPIMGVLSLIFLTLAIRIRGKVILNWIFLIATYSFRPQYYIFDKNDMACREVMKEEVVKKVKTRAKQKAKVQEKTERPSLSEVMALENAVLDPNRNVRFALNKKGGIHVSVSESK